MEVPSPIQEEGSNGTPSSRGTGTTSSSSASSRRPGFAGEELGSRYSPMGAAVRQSQVTGLLPVAEGSHEGNVEQQAVLEDALQQLPPLTVTETPAHGLQALSSSYDVSPTPIVSLLPWNKNA